MKLNSHLELGKLNTLRADRLTPHGIFLMAEDGKDVLLPQAYVTDDMQEDSLIEVFLYTDSEDRLIATTLKPKAMLDQFALLEVVDTAKFGAFLDWGLPKDLLCPTKLQKNPFKVGEKHFIKVVYDERTHRLVASEKTTDFFKKNPKGLYPKQEVSIIPILKTPLGYKCIVADNYEGLIYDNEIFEKVIIGEERTGYIKTVRQDGNIDISLRPIGNKNNSSAADKVFALLEENGGIMPYNYKSDAELIKDVFGLSKKEFKRTLTKLQEDGKIEIKDTGIYKR
ncbi:S1-like domain-containing RNA-binding protein [Sulfurimonas sp. C5]|uniref:CvfB family protein n=1 Tax=Sulfurimonas sp. C5 TaxID=3036947 RepID=UPI0024558117|nr:S1-like domain-containing RNA-binding protein [Sulfurimonas sp. C5]MDH4944700.1 S1-like domain-containing RNA-binding protein [Sulfurimonas sp. C5]